jgi:hypothetical protein
MIPTQAHDFASHLLLKLENRIDAALRIGSSVDVVAQEDDCILIGDLSSKEPQEISERQQVAVDIPDRDRCHVTRV